MRAAWPAAALFALAACSGPQRILDTQGPAAQRIAELWWVLLALAVFVSVLVTVLLALALRRARARERGEDAPEIDGRRLVIAGGVVFPVVSLFSILVFSYQVGNEVFGRPSTPPALTVEVIGHQFWWEVRYPEHGISTANEVHIPAGRPVLFRVSAPDVIHSFWVPQLHGKLDMIPGHELTLRLQANEPGRYRGQCAEYCGAAHALMALWVVALPADEHAEWLASVKAAAGAGDPDGVEAGRRVFVAAGCAACHATRGAPLPEALGTPGPDLSTLARRQMIAAGTLPNTREALARWIRNPHLIKPGVRMPATPLEGTEMDALLDYLEALR